MSGTGPGEPIAIILMSYGTPDGQEAVEPYLLNIFSDPDLMTLPWFMTPFRPLLARSIARKRAPEARQSYAQLGGRSPLVELTAAQGEALVRALEREGRFQAFLGMRYWRPRTPDALRGILAAGIRRVVLLPMFPQYARATVGSAINDFRRAARSLGADDLRVHAVRGFAGNDRMVRAMAGAIRRTLEEIPADERPATPLLFSAHGVPRSVIDRGDPYQAQVEATVAAVLRELGGHPETTICYQSRVGRREWVRPYTEEVVNKLIARRVKRIVLYPVTFVTEHSETLFELDRLYGNRIRAAGIEFRRVPALGTDPLFVAGLAGEVRAALAEAPLQL